MDSKSNAETARFKMAKERHAKSLEKALLEKKVDMQMIPLCKFISLTENFFTSSCCSGRIVLLNLDEKEEKREKAFHRKWHCTVKFQEILEGISESSGENLWLKQEPFIIHIGANSLKNANIALEAMHSSGIKRGGINVAKSGKFLLEFIGSNVLSVPVKVSGKKIVENMFLEKIVEISNKKLERNYKALERFEIECRKKFK